MLNHNFFYENFKLRSLSKCYYFLFCVINNKISIFDENDIIKEI